MTSQNHLIEESCNIMIGSSLRSLVTIGIMAVENFLVCHEIQQDHVIKGPSDFIDRSPKELNNSMDESSSK